MLLRASPANCSRLYFTTDIKLSLTIRGLLPAALYKPRIQAHCPMHESLGKGLVPSGSHNTTSL